jgi:ketosteroid isomerase-like protein
MKLLTILVLSAATSAISFAQDTDREADKQELRALAAKYEAAINQGSFSELQDSAAPEVSAVFMTGVEVKGIKEMQKYYEEIKTKIGSGGSYTIKLLPDDTDFHGNVAVAHGASDETVILGNGKRITYQSHWTAVLEKVNGKWIALRLHVSIDPIDNPFVTMKMGMMKWMNLGIGGLAGLVIAWLIMKLKSKSGCCKP